MTQTFSQILEERIKKGREIYLKNPNLFFEITSLERELEKMGFTKKAVRIGDKITKLYNSFI